MKLGDHEKLPLFRLLDAFEDVSAPGPVVWEGPHKKAEGAHEYRYEIPLGHIHITVWHGVLHEVIYDTPADDDDQEVSYARDWFLFQHYGEGQLFREILDAFPDAGGLRQDLPPRRRRALRDVGVRTRRDVIRHDGVPRGEVGSVAPTGS